MSARTTRFRQQLTHPATIIAIFALLVAGSTGAYAATVITGANIKDGTVTGADLKTGSVPGTDIKDLSVGLGDLAPSARGARAVAAVWGDASGCTIIADRSRGFTSCVRTAAGSFRVTFAASVVKAGSYPGCSMGDNGGFSTVAISTCTAGWSAADSQAVVVHSYSLDPEGTAPVLEDPTVNVPLMVFIP